MIILRQTALRPRRRAGRRFHLTVVLVLAAMMAFALVPTGIRADDQEEVAVALSLAKLLQSGRAVISRNQNLINDPAKGDKGLSGDVVLAATVENYKKATGIDPRTVDPASRHGHLLQAEMAAVKEVVDENQSLINEKGVGFKGFIPATFARLVTESLQKKVGSYLEIKVTAPPALVRNRKSRPDDWEKSVIEEKFLSASWTRGQIFSQEEPNKGRPAFRVMVPEYYAASCLSCHGQKKGEVDITGYPKEGASEGDLGGIISISLFRQGE